MVQDGKVTHYDGSTGDVVATLSYSGGDYFDDEILGWNRLRAERQVIVQEDDSSPIVVSLAKITSASK